MPVQPRIGIENSVSGVGEMEPNLGATHNAALQVVAGTAQEDLLLHDLLLGRHLVPFAIRTGGDVDEGAVKPFSVWRKREGERGRAEAARAGASNSCCDFGSEEG